jgi:hypothetical protein
MYKLQLSCQNGKSDPPAPDPSSDIAWWHRIELRVWEADPHSGSVLFGFGEAGQCSWDIAMALGVKLASFNIVVEMPPEFF